MATPDPQKRAAPRLGELEMQVLEHLWAVESATAREVHEHLGRLRGVSLNTIQSTLDRLHRKSLLDRRKVSRAFHYSTGLSRAGLLALMVTDAARRLGEGGSGAMAALLDAAEEIDETALDDLERLIEARRVQSEPRND